MKSTILSLVFAMALLSACSSTKYNTSTSNEAFSVPSGIQTSFTTLYPTATNVTWSAYDANTVPIDWELNDWTVLGSDDYVATFDMNGRRYYSWYDNNGNWVGSTYSIADYTTLPPAINTMIRDRYNAYTIEKVQREMWKDRMAYEVKLKNGDSKLKLLIDDNGNILKEKNK
jgi:hypothetical protein